MWWSASYRPLHVVLQRVCLQDHLGNAQGGQQVWGFLSHDEMLRGIMATIPPPADKHEDWDAIDQVERGEGIYHVAEARILQQNSATTAGQMGRTGDAQRHILAHGRDISDSGVRQSGVNDAL